MVQTYNFGSMSSQPGVAPGQDGDLFDSSGNLKGLCLAALAGSEVTDPVRTRLAPQPMRHQSVASCAVFERHSRTFTGSAASFSIFNLRHAVDSPSEGLSLPLWSAQPVTSCRCRHVQ